MGQNHPQHIYCGRSEEICSSGRPLFFVFFSFSFAALQDSGLLEMSCFSSMVPLWRTLLDHHISHFLCEKEKYRVYFLVFGLSLRRGKNRYHLAVGVSSRVKTFARKGAREGDGLAAMDTLSIRTSRHNPDKNPYLFTEPRRVAVLCLPPSSLKEQHVHNHMDKHLLVVELSLLLLAWDSLHRLSLNLKVRVAAKPAKGYFPLSRFRFPN